MVGLSEGLVWSEERPVTVALAGELRRDVSLVSLGQLKLSIDTQDRVLLLHSEYGWARAHGGRGPLRSCLGPGWGVALPWAAAPCLILMQCPAMPTNKSGHSLGALAAEPAVCLESTQRASALGAWSCPWEAGCCPWTPWSWATEEPSVLLPSFPHPFSFSLFFSFLHFSSH